MLKELELEHFKGFKKTKLTLGNLTLLVGANASGKSNIRDAFRFLHGISRGYTVSEIMGQKIGDGGERLWSGIRGGSREVAFQGGSSFAIQVKFTVKEPQSEQILDATYRIEIDSSGPKVADEWLEIDGSTIINHSNNPNVYQPLLSQLDDNAAPTKELLNACLSAFRSMRFFSFSPEAMRRFSLPGQTVLDDKGENLSSVLQHLCADPTNKYIFLTSLQELTPMNVQDIDFFELPDGRILLTLIEENGHRTTAYTASDGTLRFLAIMAALFEPARFYFFEELENGLYPPRMHLLLDLIERQTAQNTVQVVASTHSAHLLNLASPTTLESASFIYRLPDHSSARIKRILSIPQARRVMTKPNIARLHAAGWLDHAVFFQDDEEDL
jgi:predicted ATPase